MNITRTVSALLSVLVVLPSASALAAGFPDVPTSHSHYDAIVYVQSEGIVSGYSDSTFRPDTTINRAEFTKIIVKSMHTEEEIQKCDSLGFSDLQYGAWYVPYICMAQKDQLISGYPNGTFGPEKTINFVEAAKILSNVFNTLNTFCSGPAPIAGSDGCPTTSGHPWYEWFVRSLEYWKAIPLSITSFDQNITRGEMAEMIWRLRVAVGKASQSYDRLQGTSANIFSVNDLYVGKKVGGMVVQSFNDTTADFKGSITLTGTYKDWNSTNAALGVCMHSFSPTTSSLLPIFSAYVGTQFCFAPTAQLYTSFPKGTEGSATVTIDHLTLFIIGGDAPANTATLSAVITVKPDIQ
jgi:hypothetical protein